MNLKQYIRGRRRGKAARDLEKEALNDPFLNDAIDGYDAVPGDHSIIWRICIVKFPVRH